MEAVFNLLYAASSITPVAFLVVMANGLLAPAIYTIRRKLPYSIGIVRAHAKEGKPNARYAYYSWLVFAGISGAVVLVLLAGIVLR
jgi:hypothetical protein